MAPAALPQKLGRDEVIGGLHLRATAGQHHGHEVRYLPLQPVAPAHLEVRVHTGDRC